LETIAVALCSRPDDEPRPPQRWGRPIDIAAFAADYGDGSRLDVGSLEVEYAQNEARSPWIRRE